jgi:hypothetical protein
MAEMGEGGELRYEGRRDAYQEGGSTPQRSRSLAGGGDDAKGRVAEAGSKALMIAGNETAEVVSTDEPTSCSSPTHSPIKDAADSPLKTPQAKDSSGYFPSPEGPSPALHRGYSSRMSPPSSSRESSPFRSTHSSAVSILGAAHSTRSSPGNSTPADFLKDRQGTRELSGPPTVGTNDTHTTAAPTSAPGPARAASRDTLSSIESYQGSPHYPNQAFAALHSQIHPTYSFHRPRSSQPSPNFFGSAAMSLGSRDFSPSENSSQTVGNTPVSSPGLYTPGGHSVDPDDHQHNDAGGHSSPYLTWTQAREPKE